MSKTIEIRIPVCPGNAKPVQRGGVPTPTGYETVTGQVALLKLGEGRLRCVIHDDVLTDYRSGMRVGTLQAVKVERMARLSSYHRTTDREAAQMTLDRIVSKVGLEKVRAVLAAPPTVNA
jgi:hypothetical protein